MMKPVKYIRVSADQQTEEGFSIEGQRSKLVAYAASQGWKLTKVEKDVKNESSYIYKSKY